MKLFYKILEPIREIHKKGIIHRDIKPSNIIIDENLEIKIIDFGSSINREEKNGEYIKVTEGYSPLEMYSISTDIDERTDIYSLFALLYFMLNKQKPMDASKRFHYPELLFEDGISDNVKKLLENFENAKENVEGDKRKAQLIFGVFPITKLRTALFLSAQVPGIHVPQFWIDELERAHSISEEEEYKVGMQLSKNLFDEINRIHPKIHLMTANNKFEVASEILA